MTPVVNTWWWGDDHLADLKVRLVGFNISYFRIRTVALWSRDGKGIATRLWAGRSQVRIPAGTRFFFSRMSRPALGSTQPIGQRVRGFFSGVISAGA